MRIPMSLRTVFDEAKYQAAKKTGELKALKDEPSIREWHHWRLIENRFPYSSVMAKHHMLVPRREVGDISDLNPQELMEMILIVNNILHEDYDFWFVNTPKRRSILTHFHVHLAAYVSNRKDIKL